MRISKRRVLRELLENKQLPVKNFHTLEQVELEKNTYLGSHYWDFAAYICRSFNHDIISRLPDVFADRYMDLEVTYVFVEKKYDQYHIDVIKRKKSKNWQMPILKIEGQHIDGEMLWKRQVAKVRKMKFYFGLNEVYSNLPDELFQ